MLGFLKKRGGYFNRSTGATAVIDASTVYGAGRWYFGDHQNPKWQYASEFRAAEDKLLFEDLLHNLLLYDKILLDNTCNTVAELRDELVRVIDVVNDRAGFPHIEQMPIAPKNGALSEVVDQVCRILASKDESVVSSAYLPPIPWYYKTHSHHDFPAFAASAEKFGLSAELLPLALFIYRGLCYSGYANHFRKKHHVPVAYLASPGRLRALQPILSKEVMKKIEYPHSAYADLVNSLDLPQNGYDFSDLLLEPSHLSSLAMLMADRHPEESLKLVYELRETTEGRAIRKTWASRIWASSASCAVSATTSNVIAGATIYGNVKMVLHAAA